MDAQLKKGLLELFILRLIDSKEVYGYVLINELNVLLSDISESAYYAILRRLVKSNYIEIYHLSETKGPKRNYYRMTDEGKSYYNDKVEDLRTMVNGLRSIGIEL